MKTTDKGKRLRQLFIILILATMNLLVAEDYHYDIWEVAFATKAYKSSPEPYVRTFTRNGKVSENGANKAGLMVGIVRDRLTYRFTFVEIISGNETIGKICESGVVLKIKDMKGEIYTFDTIEKLNEATYHIGFYKHVRKIDLLLQNNSELEFTFAGKGLVHQFTVKNTDFEKGKLQVTKK